MAVIYITTFVAKTVVIALLCILTTTQHIKILKSEDIELSTRCIIKILSGGFM